MFAARVAPTSRRPQAQSELNCRFVRGESRRPASRDTTRVARVSAPPRTLPDARKVSRRASLVEARLASWVMPASGGSMRLWVPSSMARGAPPTLCGGPRGSSGRCLNRWRVRLTRSAHLAWSVRDHISCSSSFREEPPSCATLVVCAAFPPQRNAALPDSGAEPLSPQRRFLTTTDPPLSPRR